MDIAKLLLSSLGRCTSFVAADDASRNKQASCNPAMLALTLAL